MSKQHRFTGRELSSLLEQVREELGAEATIVEANKVRTGGVAGFFKTEKYEVVASSAVLDTDEIGAGQSVRLDLVEPDGSPAPAFPRVAQALAGELVDDHIDLDTAIEEVRAERFQDVPDTLDIRTPLPSTMHRHHTDAATSPVDRAAGTTEIPTLDPAAMHPFQPPVIDRPIATPTPVAATTAQQTAAPTSSIPSYFDTLAAAQQAEAATALLDRPTPTAAPPAGAAPDMDRRFGDVLTAELQQPDISVRTTETDDFWNQLGALGTTLEPLDLNSQIVTIVGNRNSALAVARRLEGAATGMKPALAAISPSPDDLDMPAWQVIDTTTELDDRLRFWNQADRTGVVIIDADLGEDATSMVERVRAAGSGVLHLTIDDELSPQRIDSLMHRLGGNVVIDLTFRSSPEYALTLIDSSIPLASVNGHDVDAGLVLALRQAMARG